MFGLFNTKPLLSEEDLTFQIASYKWLLTHFGGEDFKQSRLILPTRDYFPAQVETADEAAEQTFLKVKEYAGMQDWPCRFEKQQEDINPQVAPALVVQNLTPNPLGTFDIKDNQEFVITYNPKLATNPTQLVATLAHELAHYLTCNAPEAPPGGWENWEFATDIAATFLGFGIFMANSAFQFQQYGNYETMGWQSNRSGYLSQTEHIFALAIYLKLQGQSINIALPYLKPNLRKLLKRA